MRKTLCLAVVCMLATWVVGMAGCGSGGDDGGNQPPIDSTPSISNLRYSPSSATLNQGGGAITVNG